MSFNQQEFEEPAKTPSSQLLEGPVNWYQDIRVLEIAADRTLGSALSRIDEEHVNWVVVVRTRQEHPEIEYYAFRSRELKLIGERPIGYIDNLVKKSIDFHEWISSSTTRGGRLLSLAPGCKGPASCRVIEFSPVGTVTAIGERSDLIEQVQMELEALRDYVPEERSFGEWSDRGAIETYKETDDWLFNLQGELYGFDDKSAPEDDLDIEDLLGPTRGGSGEPTAPGSSTPRMNEESTAEIEVTLSAETNVEVEVDAIVRVPFQIELTSEAMPLAVSKTALARKDVPIVVSISVENEAIEVLQRMEFEVDSPSPGKPSMGFFTVKGRHLGISRLAIAFRQGGSDIGVIGLALEVVCASASTEISKGQVVSETRDIADDEKLALLIEQRVEGNQIFYDYTLHSEELGLPYRRLRSQPLLDRGGGPAATAITFVERIYERVTQELKSLDDLKQLQREARALGVSLCRELFDPEVSKVLWPLRDRIKVIQIRSWEPYIPWELVRLQDPSSDEVDERFLCEYGLVRLMSDDMPPLTLAMEKWAYLGATFPMGSFPPVGAELEYFTSKSPKSLHSHGIEPLSIKATRDSFYDALAECDFDVLHISCHAESLHQSIENASLIIGDETPPGDSNPRLVEVNTSTVEVEAKLMNRKPLVFLNACETGRSGAVLTAWGGWPNVFIRKGAGAFVGSAWAVRDKPAAVFSTTFYNTLLDGKTLAEAASEARAAAKKLGDASWLAFKVYGHPRARRANLGRG